MLRQNPGEFVLLLVVFKLTVDDGYGHKTQLQLNPCYVEEDLALGKVLRDSYSLKSVCCVFICDVFLCKLKPEEIRGACFNAVVPCR